MHIGPQEWKQLQGAHRPAAQLPTTAPGPFASLYQRLGSTIPDEGVRQQAAQFLREQIGHVEHQPSELPEHPADLLGWMEANTADVHARYADYLAERKAGAPRRYFGTRAHALFVLRGIAPTKLVDGAWLYGLVAHWRNPRLADLVRTYVEELGEGQPDKNHVLLYRTLLARHALDPLDDLPDELWLQGAIQLSLGWNAEQFLPEVIGFNLGYEQLPLHLLITAYELNELGLDPYYFTLHVTVDNAGTGHARRACQAALDLLPRIDGAGEFWRRMRNGCKLACTGPGTTAVIGAFDVEQEVLRILARKSVAGNGAHSDYCRVAGRSVNDWLSDPGQMPGFLQALEAAGWIMRGQPPAQSRFWRLLQGDRAEMFGVFSSYELQVIHDWIRGDAAVDGRAWDEGGGDPATPPRRRPTFRAMARHSPHPPVDSGADLLDPDLAVLRERLARSDSAERTRLLVDAMSPATHWSPAGLEATRQFWATV
ncbi:iron-containing redox enzyme family protein [Ramlibacter sp. AW1]|uniref:Iron-containing redox enzyme family protein n=1 Tax=Ramlibacter aurantiacus TaxID=2801330 RepID=A0A936ZQ31_9BURK|nr:iron-containing redox enzyme family protein [Ramlibacter aurantiacus]MBL0421480.1 iron-containing redox enzyme family protein [Ramlibacter aurantiacus]